MYSAPVIVTGVIRILADPDHYRTAVEADCATSFLEPAVGVENHRRRRRSPRLLVQYSHQFIDASRQKLRVVVQQQHILCVAALESRISIPQKPAIFIR